MYLELKRIKIVTQLNRYNIILFISVVRLGFACGQDAGRFYIKLFSQGLTGHLLKGDSGQH